MIQAHAALHSPSVAARHAAIDAIRQGHDARRNDDLMGSPDPAPDCLEMREWAVFVTASHVAAWQAEYVKARTAIGAANVRVATLARAGWNVADQRREFVGAAMRKLNSVRRSLIAAERAHRDAVAAVDAVRIAAAPAAAPFALAA
jgi:hypothetical protein